MRFSIADLLLLTCMIASQLAMWQSPEIFPWLLALLACLFAVPVCNDCLRLVTAGALSRASLLRALQPQILKWGIFWIGYFTALEFFLAFVVGGLSLMVSAFTAGWLSLLVSLSVILAPRFRRMWTLLPLVYGTGLLASAAAFSLAGGFLYILTTSDIIGGGYMADEFALLFFSPIVAGGVLAVTSALILLGLKWRREKRMML